MKHADEHLLLSFELAQRLVEAKDLNEALNVQREFAPANSGDLCPAASGSRLETSSRGTLSREPSFEYSAAAELRLEGVG